MTQPSPASPPACKLCGSQSQFLESCDFHANAKLRCGYYDKPLLPAGLMIDYYICPSCGFTFTPFMDTWLPGDFATYVYNKDYPRIDGSYNGYRAGACANIFYLGFHDYLSQLDFLDYGGGIGVLAALLQAFGARRSLSYDPFARGVTRPTGTFNVVTCLEVLEHSINPRQTVADLVSFADPDSSLIFVSTECTPPDIREQKTNWWYITPRVGHVSFFPQTCLDSLFAAHGMRMVHIESHTHIAYRQWPLWAAQFLPAQWAPQV